MKILVTGGTVFASRYIAEYFRNRGHDVFVLNRGTRQQPEGVTPILCDRHNLSGCLNGYDFDAVLDVSAYSEKDVVELINALTAVRQYIFVSSSAVYPETNLQPFREDASVGVNRYWGSYGTNKIAAEKYLLAKMPQAYILRPPYLYGKMNNLYREAFVFDCAERDMPFYLPGEGKMPLQFFDIEDMCRFMALLLERTPEQHIFNVGNPNTVTVREWVQMCYEVLGKEPVFQSVTEDVEQRAYFPFYNYAYALDVSRMEKLMRGCKPLHEGLKESYEWYKENRFAVNRKPYIEYISNNLRKKA